MATSHYFNNFSANKINEQRMYEDLLSESIRIGGHDVYYLPRENWDDTDEIFGENIHSKFERAYHMEMYLANIEGFEGDSEFFSKFGLEIRDTSNFILSKRTFDKYVPSELTTRPREGDLIFVPVFNKIFEIKFVEEELLFFSKGRRLPYLYELRAEAFRYGNEQINTGVEQIDEVESQAVYSVKLNLTGSGNFLIGETVYQGSNVAYSSASATVQNWDPNSNELTVITIKGNLNASANIRGETSGTNKSIAVLDSMGDNVYYDLYNNKDLQLEANNFVDLSEINPFGNP